MFAAISDSHLSPLHSNFSLLYSNSSCVSVENSKLGPSTMASTGHASCERKYKTNPDQMEKMTTVGTQKYGFVSTHLTKSAINAFRHVNIVSCGSSAAIGTFLSLNGNGLGWTDGFTQFASDASLFTAWISA